MQHVGRKLPAVDASTAALLAYAPGQPATVIEILLFEGESAYLYAWKYITT
ncbi:MAG: hypothetical protein ACPGXK_03490 [Phycisphaerae bacterium]